MSSVAIMRALMTADAGLTAVVPAERIFAGGVPQGETLPAIGIKEISNNELPTVARASLSVTTNCRVQVTVHAKSLADQKRVLRLARLGPGVHRGTVLGYRVQNVIPAGVGPDLNDLEDDSIYQQSRDFMVTFAEAS